MKKLGLISSLVLASVMLVASAFAAVTISADFTYDKTSATYTLYMDGTKVCSAAATGTATKNMKCPNATVGYGAHAFTMTAIADGMETKHSPTFNWTYSQTPATGPTMLNISVTAADGTVSTLGSVKLEKTATKVKTAK